MFHYILVLVRRIEKVTESNRKYKRVTVKTEKAEYGHVLTHAPSQRIREIHNRLPQRRGSKTNTDDEYRDDW